MDSRKPKSQLISHTVAPPADAPSLDVARLDRQFHDMELRNSSKTVKSSKAVDPPHRPSSSASKRHEPSHQPSSSASRRHEPSYQPSYQPSSRAQRGTVLHGSVRHPTQPLKESMPPAYKTYARVLKASQPGAPSSARHSERASSSKIFTEHSPYRENKKSHIPSSRQATERGQSTIRQKTEHGTYPEEKKSHVPSSSRHQSSQKTTNITLPAGTARVKTEHYQLGNMNRTILEGMVPKTKYDSSSAASHKSYPATQHTIGKSRAPPTAKTILVSPEDVSMARRQTQYATLAPSERVKQDHWVQSMIAKNGSCPQGFAWKRITDGYQCDGGHHIISDQLLQEGRGGIWAVDDPMEPDDRVGPYYAEPSNPTLFLYAGPQPRPFDAPPHIGDAGPGMTMASQMRIPMSNVHASRLQSQVAASRRAGPQFVPMSSAPSSRFPPGSQHHLSRHNPSQFHHSHHGSGVGPGPSGI